MDSFVGFGFGGGDVCSFVVDVLGSVDSRFEGANFVPSVLYSFGEDADQGVVFFYGEPPAEASCAVSAVGVDWGPAGFPVFFPQHASEPVTKKGDV